MVEQLSELDCLELGTVVLTTASPTYELIYDGETTLYLTYEDWVAIAEAAEEAMEEIENVKE